MPPKNKVRGVILVGSLKPHERSQKGVLYYQKYSIL